MDPIKVDKNFIPPEDTVISETYKSNQKKLVATNVPSNEAVSSSEDISKQQSSSPIVAKVPKKDEEKDEEKDEKKSKKKSVNSKYYIFLNAFFIVAILLILVMGIFFLYYIKDEKSTSDFFQNISFEPIVNVNSTTMNFYTFDQNYTIINEINCSEIVCEC